MSRMIVVAGVHLDRAWPDLGSAFGKALRRWSREALALVVEESRRHGVGTILVLGDLMDRSTVLPETVEYAATVLGSFSGNVCVTPGPTDWVGSDGPYELGTWGSNTHVWTSADYRPCPSDPTLWGSAWTSPSSHAPRVPMGGATGQRRTLVRAGLSIAALGGLSPVERAVTSGSQGGDRMLAVPDLVHKPDDTGGCVLLLDTERPETACHRILLPGQPGALVEVNVTGLEVPTVFEAALKQACAADGPVLVRLVGELGAQVLLPGFGGCDLPANAVLDLASLTYAVEVPDAGDRSTRAEFLRAIALTRGDDRERHQTTALGLQAVTASAAGA